MENVEKPAAATNEQSAAEAETKQIMNEFASILFKTSNSKVGSTAHLLQSKGPFCKSNKFSDALSGCMYTSNGLNTIRPTERYLDN